MGNIKLFSLHDGCAKELVGTAADIEKKLQNLVEANLETLLGVRFLASEYGTGKTHAGRIDSLGIDENDCPVILEYKRHTNENVINQGLFYMDWLLDHKAEFKEMVAKKIDAPTAEAIEWSGTRLLCIAEDFTRYDQYAVNQIGRNIELIRYRRFGDELLLLELVNAPLDTTDANSTQSKSEKPHKDQISAAPKQLAEIDDYLSSFIHSLGDDIVEKELKHYTAYRRFKNFACVSIFPKQDPHLKVWLKLEIESLLLEEGFTRDVSNMGHHGTGNLVVTIRSLSDLDKAKPLIAKSYEGN